MIRAECGHETELSGTVKSFGAEKQYQLKVEGGKVHICLRCLGDAAIRCAWCGKPIFPGDPVTLYGPVEKGIAVPGKEYKPPAYAVVHTSDPLHLIGCARTGCMQAPTDKKGFWVHPGRVALIQGK